MNIQKRTAESGDVYAYYIESLHKYSACQVIRVNQESKSICYVALDYLGEEPPEQTTIESLKPYYRQAFRWNHNIVKELINNSPVPRDYLFIGQCPLKTDDKCNTFAGGWPKGLDYIYEERWKAFDENARAVYKKYCNSGDFVTVKGQMFKKNRIGLTDDLYQCLTEKDSLKDFPCIIFAEVNGYHGKLVKWCRETPLLAELRLKNAGVELLDLSETHLDHLELDLSGVKRLILPKSLVSLHIYGSISSELQIDDRLCTKRIEVRVSVKAAQVQRFGMNNAKISMLRIDDNAELDMQPVADIFPEIEIIVRQYTLKFNQLNEKYGEFIETEERDDIFTAMQQLYEECILHGKCGETDETNAGITLGEIWDIMDVEREDW